MCRKKENKMMAEDLRVEEKEASMRELAKLVIGANSSAVVTEVCQR